MRKKRSNRRSLLPILVLLMAMSLPASVLFSLEEDASELPETVTAASAADFAVALPAATGPAVRFGRYGVAPQPASMFIAGSLLIGLGSMVRRRA